MKPFYTILFYFVIEYIPISYILSGSIDKSAKMWDLVSGKCINTFITSKPINSVKTTDGKFDLISAKNVELVNIKNSNKNSLNYFMDSKLLRFNDLVYSTISDCGSIIAVSTKDGLVKIIESSTLKVITTIITYEYHSLNKIIISKDLKELIVCSDVFIYIFDIVDGSMMNEIVNPSRITSIQIYYKKEKPVYFTGSEDGMIRIYNSNGILINELYDHFDYITTMSINKDLMIIGSKDATASIYDLSSMTKIDHFTIHKYQEYSAITSAVFSRENTFCILGNSNGEIAIYDVQSQKVLKWLDGHQESITSLSIQTLDLKK